MLEALEASGLSAGRFAKQHGLSSQRVYWWRSQLGRGGGAAAVIQEAPAFVPVRVTALSSAAASEERAEATLEITVRGASAIRVRRGFDSELLRQVVAALEGATC